MPNVMLTIPIARISFSKNNEIDFKETKRKKMLNAPKRLPKNNRFKGIFLFKVTLTVIKRRKSKKKLRKKRASK